MVGEGWSFVICTMPLSREESQRSSKMQLERICTYKINECLNSKILYNHLRSLWVPQDSETEKILTDHRERFSLQKGNERVAMDCCLGLGTVRVVSSPTLIEPTENQIDCAVEASSPLEEHADCKWTFNDARKSPQEHYCWR